MDTHGLFDNQTSPDTNWKIFSLSVLISSLQIFNISGVIDENSLQHLQYAAEIAKFMKKSETDEKCFQSILFLLRDWTNKEDYSYGFKRGQKYLDTFFETNADLSIDHLGVRQSITTLFDKIDKIACCLLPRPGEIVTQTNYDGQWKTLSLKFRKHLKKTIETILGHKNLVVKQINGQHIEGFQFAELINKYIDAFMSDDFPKTITIFNLIVERQIKKVIEKCLEMFKKTLREKNVEEKDFDFDLFYKTSFEPALNEFDRENKIGGTEVIQKYKEELTENLKIEFEVWKMPIEYKLKYTKKYKRVLKSFLEMSLELMASCPGMQLAAAITAYNFLEAISTCLLATLKKYEEIKQEDDFNLTDAVNPLSKFYMEKLETVQPLLCVSLSEKSFHPLINLALSNEKMMREITECMSNMANIKKIFSRTPDLQADESLVNFFYQKLKDLFGF